MTKKRSQSKSRISHIIGDRDEELSYLPKVGQIDDFEAELIRTVPTKIPEPPKERPEDEPTYMEIHKKMYDDFKNGIPWREKLKKDSRRNFTEMEKSALIEEQAEMEIRNKDSLDLEGTHYVQNSPNEIFMQMPKGL